MRKVNLKDVAQELGVSISTVSKALRGSYEIGNETKQKIADTAKKMGYTPNPYAGFLRNHKSKTIALVAPELNNNFFIQAISGAEEIAQDKDYHILVYSTHENYEKEKSILHHLQNGRVDGVIMSVASTTKDFIPANMGIGLGYVFNANEKHQLGLYFDLNRLLVPTPIPKDVYYDATAKKIKPEYDKNANGV